MHSAVPLKYNMKNIAYLVGKFIVIAYLQPTVCTHTSFIEDSLFSIRRIGHSKHRYPESIMMRTIKYLQYEPEAQRRFQDGSTVVSRASPF